MRLKETDVSTWMAGVSVVFWRSDTLEIGHGVTRINTSQDPVEITKLKFLPKPSTGVLIWNNINLSSTFRRTFKLQQPYSHANNVRIIIHYLVSNITLSEQL
jgi:hypothetical protein